VNRVDFLLFSGPFSRVYSTFWYLASFSVRVQADRVEHTMIAMTGKGGHSAQVTIKLLLDGGSFHVAQLGLDFLLLDAPFDHPPGNARVVLRVDQNERGWEVRLTNGISAASSRVAIARI
jgi:hypothetical protein